MQSVLLECPWSTCLIVDNCALIHCAALHYGSFSSCLEPVMAEDKHKQFTQFALQLPQSGSSFTVIQCRTSPRTGGGVRTRRPSCWSAAHESKHGEMIAATVYPALRHSYFPAVCWSCFSGGLNVVFSSSVELRTSGGAKGIHFHLRQMNV